MKRYCSVTAGGAGSERAKKNPARRNFSGSHRSGIFLAMGTSRLQLGL